jgi:hypothetical protein
MPKAFAILINVIIGYLDGAGLGALSLELFANPGDSQAHAALLALLMIGPLGALLGLAVRRHYNHHRYHESLDNLAPADVYFGRGCKILMQRERIKRLTIQNRRLQHQMTAA